MKIIQEANTRILSKLERLFWDFNENLKYKIHRYVIITPSEKDTVLLYNTLTKELVELDEGEDVFSQFFLMHLFIVPEDFHEEILPMLIRDVWESQRVREIVPIGYTILATTACNARCFYCYEKNDPKKPMSEKTAEDVGDFIIKNYRKRTEGNEEEKKIPVKLGWFGGEPLFRKKCIDIICGKLRDADVPYKSSMISNGYLFNEATVKTARELWNLGHVQITIDGTQDVYNKTKAYIYKDENPFETLMGNIHRLTENRISVSIRINVGKFNLDDVDSLIDVLVGKFKGNPLVSVYFHTLFDTFDSDMTSDEDNRKVFKKMIEFETRMGELGMEGGNKALTNSYNASHCMADSGQHLCILTDGKLTLCEHYTHDHEIGTIYDFPDKVDWDMVDMYREVTPPFQQCYGCPLMVDCSYLKICADNDRFCTPARQEYLINRMLRRINKRYHDKMEGEKRHEKMRAERRKILKQQGIGEKESTE